LIHLLTRGGWASYTDDSSLDTRLTHSRRVSVHAQVLANASLEWLSLLLRACPVPAGELKSKYGISDAFFYLTQAQRALAINSLAAVRVHINDPQPYFRNIERMFHGRSIEDVVMDYSRILGRDRATEFEVVIFDHVSANILWDAPSERLKRDARAILIAAGLRLGTTLYFDCDDDELLEREDDLSFFRTGKRYANPDKIAEFASKSSAVFAGPQSTLVDVVSTDISSVAPIFRLLADLRTQHAFDDGNVRALEWIEAKRSSVIAAVDPYWGAYRLWYPPVLASVPSEKSLEVQAADVAAGIAKRLLERKCIRALLNVFPWVMYNGERLSSHQADRIGKLTSAGVQIMLRNAQ
jgi:hypothetical protein